MNNFKVSCVSFGGSFVWFVISLFMIDIAETFAILSFLVSLIMLVISICLLIGGITNSINNNVKITTKPKHKESKNMTNNTMRKQTKEERKAKRLAIGTEIKDTVQEIIDFTSKMTYFIDKGLEFGKQAEAITKLTNKRRILEVSKDAVVVGEELIKEQDILEKEYEQLMNKINLLLNKYSRSDFDWGCLEVNMNCNRDIFIKLKDRLVDASETVTKIELKNSVYELQDYIEENSKENKKDAN